MPTSKPFEFNEAGRLPTRSDFPATNLARGVSSASFRAAGNPIGYRESDQASYRADILGTPGFRDPVGYRESMGAQRSSPSSDPFFQPDTRNNPPFFPESIRQPTFGSPSSHFQSAEPIGKPSYREPLLNQAPFRTESVPHSYHAEHDHVFIEPKWVYKDPEGQLQGPFSTEQMTNWHKEGYFPLELPIKRTTEVAFLPLFKFLEKFRSESPFFESVQEQKLSERKMNHHPSEFGFKNEKRVSTRPIAPEAVQILPEYLQIAQDPAPVMPASPSEPELELPQNGKALEVSVKKADAVHQANPEPVVTKTVTKKSEKKVREPKQQPVVEPTVAEPKPPVSAWASSSNIDSPSLKAIQQAEEQHHDVQKKKQDKLNLKNVLAEAEFIQKKGIREDVPIIQKWGASQPLKTLTLAEIMQEEATNRKLSATAVGSSGGRYSDKLGSSSQTSKTVWSSVPPPAVAKPKEGQWVTVGGAKPKTAAQTLPTPAIRLAKQVSGIKLNGAVPSAPAMNSYGASNALIQWCRNTLRVVQRESVSVSGTFMLISGRFCGHLTIDPN